MFKLGNTLQRSNLINYLFHVKHGKIIQFIREKRESSFSLRELSHPKDVQIEKVKMFERYYQVKGW